MSEVRARRLGRLSMDERARELGDVVVIVAERGGVGAEAGARAARVVREAARPIVLLIDSEGARASEGLAALAANAEWLAALAEARVPRVAIIFGVAAGSAAYAAALCDLVVMINERSFAFVAGPALVESALGESNDLEALGGTSVHAHNGFAHLLAADDRHALALAQTALAYLDLPRAPARPPRAPAFALPPASRAYDIADVIAAVADQGTTLTLSPAHGPSIQTALARIDGRAVLLVASQPAHVAGAIDAAASQKLARFVRFATRCRLPIVTLCDTPGFLPGRAEEARGVLVHGAAVIAAYSAARGVVPRIAVVLRRAVGAGTVLVHGADVILACEGAEMVQMGGIPTNGATTFAHDTVAPTDLRAALVAALGRLA